MTTIKVKHEFFPVGQGLFATGFLTFETDRPRTYRWVYDCGTHSAKRLLTRAIDTFKVECQENRIELLTLSHFHQDHIIGVVELLNKIGAKALMLPWAPLWSRLSIGFEQGFGAADPEMQFFMDPVRYFMTAAPERFDQVVFVMPSAGEGSGVPTEDPEGREDPDGRIVIGTDTSADELEVSTYDVEGSWPEVRQLKRGQRITFRKVWEFIPFNDLSTEPADLKEFQAKVEVLKIDLLYADKRDRASALQTLEQFFKMKFAKIGMNKVSLFLYGGAVGQWRGKRVCGCRTGRWFGCPHCSPVLNTRAAILFSGDGDLSTPEKWNTLSDYLGKQRSTRTSVFQIPHHGSRNNAFSGLARAALPDLSVFSSNPVGNYYHPHKEVLRDFWPFNPVQVDRDAGFAVMFTMDK